MNAESMYRELILDHYKDPQNSGTIDKPTHSAHKHNTSCGDEFTIQLIVKDDIVSDVKFSGSGCAISTAACSMITEKIKGMTITEIKKLSDKDMIELLQIPISEGRMQCATIGLETIQEALC